MPDRKSLVFTLWLISSLALLASVLVAPIRTSGCVALSSEPNLVRGTLASPPSQPTTRLKAAVASDAGLEVSDFASEGEEQDPAEALDEPRVSFLIPSSFRKALDRQVIAPRLIFSLYPLRC